MTPDERSQIFANALKLFTDDSAQSSQAVKSLAALDALPDKLAFGSEGYIILADPRDPATYTQIASAEGRPLWWEVSSQPSDTALTPVQQRALRRYGFNVPSGGDVNPYQEWPRARVEELPGFIELVFRDVFSLSDDYAVTLAGGV
jgi:hypothetical protein